MAHHSNSALSGLFLKKKSAPAPDHYPLVVISDTHLGMGNSSTDLLIEFLQNTTCDKLVLNGDIIDGWRINMRKPQDLPEAQLRVLDAINRKIAEGTDVIYIPGNHDGELRGLGLAGKTIFGARVEHEHEITDPKGRKLLICHGDRFDPMQKHGMPGKQAKPPSKFKKAAERGYILLIDRGYDAGAKVSTIIDKVSERLLHRSVGLFSRFRTTLEGAAGTKGNMEQAAIKHAKDGGYDGIICGHFHMSAHKLQDGKLYLNSGDWVESYTALAMDAKGDWKVIEWHKARQDKGLKRTFKQAANDNPDKSFRAQTLKVVDAIKGVWPGKGGKKKPPQVK